MIGRYNGRRVGRIFPVIEHHRCRSGRATGHALVAIDETPVPIRCFLIPIAGQQRLDRCCPEFRVVLRAGSGIHFQARIFLQELNRSPVLVEHVLQARRNIVDIQTVVTISKNSLSTLIRFNRIIKRRI